ncbi:MAG: sodium:proton antiporter [Clostridiales bacterium]|nr:sodium:proton antiporter [Clostridiales bacterium]
MLTNPVVLSIIIMVVLCLLKLNVIISLLIAALAGGLLAGMPISDTMDVLVGGMGRKAETALSYILLGSLAFGIQKTGVTKILVNKILAWSKGKGVILVMVVAVASCFSQNLIPVHIAFIPILIPPLLLAMNKLKIDRRAMAVALTFGLKAPYVALPVGFGLIFHNIIRDQMNANGMQITTDMIWRVMWVPGIAMVLGLLVAVFYAYRKPREYETVELAESEVAASTENTGKGTRLNKEQIGALVGAVAALVIQLQFGSLPLGAVAGLIIMLLAGAFKWKENSVLINSGIGMMGFIAFVMLVAGGYGAVIRATGGIEPLVEGMQGLMGGGKLIAASVMILIGLFITMGIGTSFGTIPVIAAIYVPLATALGFSPAATILLIGTAAALGDAGSPASDSTLGPTAGLNADGQHDHIWDTCVPTFIYFNIPIAIFGIIGATLF